MTLRKTKVICTLGPAVDDEELIRKLIRAGMDAARISRADTVADVLEELDALLEPGDAVLVKASHFMGLTRIVEGLVN